MADAREYNRPISQWTNRELADELVAQQIVESISARHVGRWRSRPETPSVRLLAESPPLTLPLMKKSKISVKYILKRRNAEH